MIRSLLFRVLEIGEEHPFNPQLRQRSPQAGVDAFYKVPGTGGVAAVGPGDKGYHGGKWAVHEVSFTGAQFPLTSAEAILEAEDAGLITIVRVAADDFKCPIRGK